MTRMIRLALLCCAAMAVAPAAASAQWTVTIDRGAFPQGGTVADSLNEIDCGADCTGSYADNADVTFTAARAPGWSVEWGGGCRANGDACDLTVKKNRTITATFTDVEAPAVSLTAPGAAMSGAVTLAADATDNDAVQRVDFLVGGVLVGSAAAAPYEVSFDSTTLPEGPVDVAAVAYDLRPLTPNSTTASRSVVVDNTKPLVELTGGPAEGSTIGSPGDAAFAFSASDPLSGVARVECSVDGGPFAPCQSDGSHALTDLPDGSHSIGVRAVDNAGNIGDAVIRGFAVDRTAPTPSITSGPDEGSSSTAGAAGFAFTSDDPGASFECRLYQADGSAPAFGPCSGAGEHSATGLAPAGYVFEVRATDAYGNTSAAVTRRFSLVAAPPTGDGGQAATPRAGDGGGQATALPRVLSRVRYGSRIRARRARLTRLSVTGIPDGAALRLRCTGRRCPFKARTVKPAGSSINLTRKVRRGRFARGAVLEIRIVRGGMVGRVVRIRFRGARRPVRQVLCLVPGASKPAACG